MLLVLIVVEVIVIEENTDCQDHSWLLMYFFKPVFEPEHITSSTGASSSASTTTASTTSTTTTATTAGSSRAATMFVPFTAELSLFPNIPFAAEQSQTEEKHTKHTPAADPQDTTTTPVSHPSPDHSIVDDPKPVSRELEDLLLDRALALLAPAFYNPDKVLNLLILLRYCFTSSHKFLLFFCS